MEATPLKFLHELEKLKHLPRTGWLRTIQNPESVAAHSFRVAILAMLAPDDLNVDIPRCVQMALVHDLAESVIGDIPTFAGVPKDRKYAMENNGFRYLENLLLAYSPTKAKSTRDLWLEYETGETPEAKWVKEMDKLECLIQAHEYEQRTFGQKDLGEFQGLMAKIHSPEASRWAGFLTQERQNHLKRREQRCPVIFVLGDSMASEEVARYISGELILSHISVDKIIRDRAKDPQFLHYEVIQTCLKEKLDFPASLIVDLIEAEIKTEGDQQWTLISGFPTDIDQLADFEKKVAVNTLR
ncbi:hypothetical protein N7540_013043 [Penicillium herquei]|nr:hypothetical protein N7540_013043 [Penicillium herquei]